MTTPETAASATSYTPVVTDLSRLGRVLFSPTAVFEEQRDKPTFWMPWAVMAALMLVTNWFLQPFQLRVREMMMERAGKAMTPPSMVGTIIGMATSTIGVLIICLIGAAILYAIVSLFGGETTFKKLLCVIVFTLPITLILQAVTAFVLHSRGVASINGPQDMVVSVGLDLLLPSSVQPSYFTRFLLAGISLPAIWQLSITAMGLGVMAKLGKGAAWGAAIVNFLIVLVALSGLGAFGMKMAGG